MSRVVSALMLACIGFSALQYLTMFGLGFLSRRCLRRSRASNRIGARDVAVKSHLPGVSITMPAYNEEVVIVEAVRSVLAMNYPDIEVLVISDGSSDRTVEILIEAFGLTEAPLPRHAGPLRAQPVRAVFRSREDPRIVVIDKGRAGSKGDGVNCGVNFATKEWVVVMDGDELVDPDAVLRCMTQMLHTPGEVGAIGVTLLPTNECDVSNGRVVTPRVARNPIVGFQTVEYLSAFVMSRPGLAELHALPIVSGGFGLFPRAELLGVGGFSHPHLGEDLDIVVRLRRSWKDTGRDLQAIQVADAIAWTEFPASAAVLRRQRIRWHRGLRQVLGDNRDVMLRPRYGAFGTIGLGVMFLFEWLAPFLEVIGYAAVLFLAVVDRDRLVAGLDLMLATVLLGVLVTTSSVWTATHHLGVYRSGRDTARLILFAIASQFGYRQLTLYWRMRSLTSKQQAWGAMARVGYKST